jgi:predicted ATPase
MSSAPSVFISYARRDSPFVDRLAEALERRGVNVVYDRKIAVGQNWEQALSEMLSEATFVTCVMSPGYFQSKFAAHEWQQALIRESNEKRIVLLPILCERTELPVALETKRYADLTDPAEFTRGVDDLARTILRSAAKDEQRGTAGVAAVAPSSIDLPEDLVQQIAGGNCVLYAGAGLSAPAGLPGWQLFAEHLVDRAKGDGWITPQDLQFYEGALRDHKTDYVVEEVVSKAPDGFIEGTLRKMFLGRTPPDAHLAVKDLPFAAALTTNFDDLLEQTFAGRLGSMMPFTPDDPDGLRAAFTRRDFFVLKLYGTLERPQSLLVSPAQFDRAVTLNVPFHNFVESLFLSRTIFFVGCSLEGIDAYLRGVGLRAASNVQHYALAGVLGTSWEAMAGVLERRYRIRVLPYRVRDASDQLSALRALAARVHAVQGRHDAPTEQPALTRVAVSNIGAFQEVEFDLDPGVNILLGNNGVGKSTLLRAIAAAVAGKDAEPYAARLLRVGSETATIAVHTARQSYSTVVQRTTSGAAVSSLPVRVLDGEGWLALGFPPLRIASGDTKRMREPLSAPAAADVLPLVRGETDPRLADLQEWIADVDYRAKHEKQGGDGGDRYERLIQKFFEIVGHVLEGVSVTFDAVDPATKRVTVLTNDGVVPLDYVSQGTLSVISWVGVLLQRLFEIYKNDADPTGRYVLVLMDEIDAHMHPAWQRVLLPRVLECFPRMQLIATTHSPLVLNGLEARNILHVARGTDGRVSIHRHELTVKGREPDEILSGPLFGLDETRDLGTEKQEARYDELLSVPKDQRTAEQDAEREKLAKALFGRRADQVESSAEAVRAALEQSLIEKLAPSTDDKLQAQLDTAHRLLRKKLER